MRLVVSSDEEPISLFQDFARGYSPCRDDVGALPAVATLAQDLLHERGIEMSHETIRFWWNRFGPIFAAEIRKKRMNRPPASSGWRWHLCSWDHFTLNRAAALAEWRQLGAA